MSSRNTLSPKSRLITSLPVLLVVALLTACSGEEFLGGSIATMGILGILALALIIYAIIDLIKSPMDTTSKIIWGIVIWIIPFLGAILYLLIGRR